LWKHNDVQRVDDGFDLRCRKRPGAKAQAGAALVCLLQLLNEVDENVGAAPFSRVRAT